MKVSVEKALLFNFSEPERAKKVKAALLCMGAGIKEIREEDFSLPLGRFVGLQAEPDGENPPAESSAFTEEMLVLYRFSNKKIDDLLRRLKKAGVQVNCKAVLTPTNMHWSAARLIGELKQEHDAMERGETVHGEAPEDLQPEELQ